MIRTILDLLRPMGQEKAMEKMRRNHKGNRKVTFQEGETVYIPDYRNVNIKGWVKGKKFQVIGIKTCWCKTPGCANI